MKTNFFLNDGCAIVDSISRISLLDMKSIFTKKNHHNFILKLHLVTLDRSNTKRGSGK